MKKTENALREMSDFIAQEVDPELDQIEQWRDAIQQDLDEFTQPVTIQAESVTLTSKGELSINVENAIPHISDVDLETGKH